MSEKKKETVEELEKRIENIENACWAVISRINSCTIGRPQTSMMLTLDWCSRILEEAINNNQGKVE